METVFIILSFVSGVMLMAAPLLILFSSNDGGL